MTETEIIDLITKEFMDTIYKYIPNECISSNGSFGRNFNARLSEMNSAFHNTEYFYSGERKFVHWTSVQNLMSIINNREFRMYNLQKSSDENEFKFAANQLTMSENIIDHTKNYIYTLSFCEITEINNQKLWLEYGQDYSGIAIEFEIENNPMNWKNIMLSRCYYEIPKKFVKLFEDLSILKKKWNGVDTNIDLGRLIAFYKHPDFKDELEVRLSTYFPYNNIEAYWKNCNTEFIFDNERPRITDYFGLKLWVDNNSPFMQSDRKEYDRKLLIDDDYYIKHPKIIIRNIMFGENCGISNKEYIKFRQKLQEVFILKLGYEITLPLNLVRKL